MLESKFACDKIIANQKGMAWHLSLLVSIHSVLTGWILVSKTGTTSLQLAPILLQASFQVQPSMKFVCGWNSVWLNYVKWSPVQSDWVWWYWIMEIWDTENFNFGIVGQVWPSSWMCSELWNFGLGHLKLIICFWFSAWSIFCSAVVQSQD